MNEAHSLEYLHEISRRWHYLIVQVTTGSARNVVRLSRQGNGFEAWRLLHERFTLPSRTKGIDILSRILEQEFRTDFFEKDFTEFIVLTERYRETSCGSLGNEVLISLLINKTDEALQGLLRVHQDALKTFDQAVNLVKYYCAQVRSSSGRLSSFPPCDFKCGPFFECHPEIDSESRGGDKKAKRERIAGTRLSAPGRQVIERFKGLKSQEELEQEGIEEFREPCEREGRTEEGKEEKGKGKEEEEEGESYIEGKCATEEPDEFQEFEDCSDEDGQSHLGTFSHCYVEGRSEHQTLREREKSEERKQQIRVNKDAVIVLQKDCELSEVFARSQESIEDSLPHCLKPWCCDQCSSDLEDCHFDHCSDSESLPHAKEDGSAACTPVELIGRACLRVESEIAQEKQREGDASTVSRFIDAFNSSWPGDDMCLIGRSLLNMIFESATVSLTSRIRPI